MIPTDKCAKCQTVLDYWHADDDTLQVACPRCDYGLDDDSVSVSGSSLRDAYDRGNPDGPLAPWH